MARQFKRAYELQVIPTEGEVRIIRDLRINFEITKSNLSVPNLCRLTIYNANEETLVATQKRFTKIVLNAGYEGNVGLLFKGEIRNVYQGKTSTDKTITIYAGDGEKDWQNSTINKTLSENLSIRTAINEVLKTFKGLTVQTLEGVPEITDKLRGQVLSGSSKDIMDKFAAEYGFNWSIQDGEIVITDANTPLEGYEAILINSATGMLDSPIVTRIGADVRTLLNPKLLPNRAIKIESAGTEIQLGNLFFERAKRTVAEGLYKIEEVNFKGDSREGEWSAYIKGRLINV